MKIIRKKTDQNIPNRKIKAIIDMMFDDIPYSEEVVQAQEKIEDALNTEFDKIKANRHEDEALEELLGKYGKLSQMAELAGFSADDAKKWRGETQAVDYRILKKEIWKQRLRIYLTSAFSVFAMLQIFWLIYNIVSAPSAILGNIILITVDLFIASIPFRKYLKTEKSAVGNKYDTDAYKYLRALSDKYSKRLLNGIALLFAVLFAFVASELSFIFFGRSKSAEFSENFFNNSIVIEIPVFLLIKNILSLKMIRQRINNPDIKKYKKHIIGITTFSAVYWLIVFAFTIIKSKNIPFPVNVFLAAGIIFGLLITTYNFTLRRKITFQNIVINKPRIALYTAFVVTTSGIMFLRQDTWYTQSYINSVPIVEHNIHNIEYNDSTGIYTITKSTDDFKILHLTDIHIGGSLYSYRKDMKALKACYAEIEHTHPDLVIVTGDLSFPLGIMSMSLNNTAPVGQFAAFMRNTGIPWAFTYGNHDTESLASANKRELNEVYKSLSFKTSGTLLYPYIQPDVMGRNNQLIEIRNSDGSLNTGLFMIDSNAYTGEGINVYDYIHDDQVEWYTDEIMRMNSEAGHTVNSLVFFHIPLQEYKTATELYLEGSDEVKYFYGENPGDHGGITNDLVCCSDYPSKMFDTALELGSTTGFFCGHDHYNNASLEYKGIRLTYGMSIDYLAMPGIEKETKQRGAELITIHADGSWDSEQIPLDSITKPKSHPSFIIPWTEIP